GKGEEAQKDLDEALTLARELKNQALVAQTLNFQGNAMFYRGNYNAASALYEKASQAASGATDRALGLQPRSGLAKVLVKQKRSHAAIKTLSALTEESDTLGLKYLSVECSIYLAQAQLDTKDYSRAKQTLERALATSEKLGLQTLLAQSHYLLGNL